MESKIKILEKSPYRESGDFNREAHMYIKNAGTSLKDFCDNLGILYELQGNGISYMQGTDHQMGLVVAWLHGYESGYKHG